MVFSLHKQWYPVRVAVYTDDETALTDLRQRASEEMGYSGNPMYREFLLDTYMKRSDYRRLRELLGLDVPKELEEGASDTSSCYVHCLPSLAGSFRDYLGQADRSYRSEERRVGKEC